MRGRVPVQLRPWENAGTRRTYLSHDRAAFSLIENHIFLSLHMKLVNVLVF